MIAEPQRWPELQLLPDSQLWRLDQICDSFESAWKSGHRPRVETFLDAADGLVRQVLLRELLLLEVEYRRRRGEDFQTAEYQDRFPELDGVWLEAHLHCATQIAAEVLGADPVPDRECEDSAGLPAQEAAPRTLGHFQLLERVGVGCFGTVWRALDLRLGRTVARKVPHVHLIEHADEVARFYREARAAAQLRHPGIVSVHEVALIDGLPVIVCEFVTGKSLRDLLACHRIGLRPAVHLVAKVADALAYAHAMGAIHRDVKPANIMLDVNPAAGADGDQGTDRPGEPRLVDFGLVFLDQESIHLTHDGTILGTPAYMSPEQAAGSNAASPVDHRTDIYSLGVVLFELITGSLPFTGTLAELLHQILSAEPRRPRQFDRAIPRDLESICLKAMAKEPRHRYASVRQMAEDLRHFLEGEPVRARPVSLWQRCLRRAQRRPVEAALGLMVAVAVLAVTGLAVGYRYHLRLEDEFRATVSARQDAEVQERRARSYLYFNRMALAEREWSVNNIERVERLLEDCPEDLRDWEWRYLKRQCRQDLVSVEHALSTTRSWTVTGVQFSPDGRLVASSSKDGTVRLWDAASGQPLGLLGRHKRAAFSLAFQPGSRLLASGGDDGDILVWDTAGSLVRTLPKGTDTVYALAFSPDGRFLASGHGYPPLEEVDHMRGHGLVRIWDAGTGLPLRTLPGHTQNVTRVAFSPDGRALASVSGSSLAVPQYAGRPGELLLWDVETGEPTRKIAGHAGPLTGVSYQPKGDLIATSSWDRTVRLWDPATGRLHHSLTGHQDWVLDVAFSPDGSRLATGGADGAIKLWDPATGQELFTLRGHGKNVTGVAFSPDGRRLASSSSDQTVKFWDATANPEVKTWRGDAGPISRVACFPDGTRILAAGNTEDEAGRVRPNLVVLDITHGSEVMCVDRHTWTPGWPIDGIAIRPDGGLVAAASLSGHLEAWTLPGWRPCFRHDEPLSRFQAVAISPDGRKLATVGQSDAHFETGEATPNETGDNALVMVLDLQTGEVDWRVAGSEVGIIRDLAFSPDGATIATADNIGTVTLWDGLTGRVKARFRDHSRVASHVTFSPDGKRLASASWDSTAIVWDPAIRHPITRLQGHMRSVLCVAFSPDGRRLATSSEDQTVRLWDTETGQEVLTLRGHSNIVTTVAFSPDGSRLVSAGADGTVQIREASPRPVHPSPARSGRRRRR